MKAIKELPRVSYLCSNSLDRLEKDVNKKLETINRIPNAHIDDMILTIGKENFDNRNLYVQMIRWHIAGCQIDLHDDLIEISREDFTAKVNAMLEEEG